MNVVLQSLLAVGNFYTDLCSHTWTDAQRVHAPLWSALSAIGGRVKQRGSLQYAIDASTIKAAIGRVQQQFAGHMQQDAHEFLTYCLDTVQEEGNVVKSKQLLPLPHCCPVEANFSCEIEHIRTCSACKRSSEPVKEFFRDFSITVPDDGNTLPKPSIQQLMEAHFEDTCVEYTCETCGSHTSTIRHHIRRLPRVLVLHLKRFRFDVQTMVRSKTQSPIDLSKHLDLGFCTDATTILPSVDLSERTVGYGMAAQPKSTDDEALVRESHRGESKAVRMLSFDDEEEEGQMAQAIHLSLQSQHKHHPLAR